MFENRAKTYKYHQDLLITGVEYQYMQQTSVEVKVDGEVGVFEAENGANLTSERKKPGPKNRPTVPGRQSLYAKLARHSRKAIKTLIELLDDKQSTVRIAAARELLSRTVPTLSAVAVNHSGNGPGLTVKFQLYGSSDPIIERQIAAKMHGVQVLEAPQKQESLAPE